MFAQPWISSIQRSHAQEARGLSRVCKNAPLPAQQPFLGASDVSSAPAKVSYTQTRARALRNDSVTTVSSSTLATSTLRHVVILISASSRPQLISSQFARIQGLLIVGGKPFPLSANSLAVLLKTAGAVYLAFVQKLRLVASGCCAKEGKKRTMLRAWLLLLALGCAMAQPPPSESDLSDVLSALAEPGVNGMKFNATADTFYEGVRTFSERLFTFHFTSTCHATCLLQITSG